MLLAETTTAGATMDGMNTTDYLSTMGKRLRIHREEMGLSQVDLVGRMRTYGVRVKSQHISGIERNGKAPSVEVLAAIARALETSTDYLLMLSDDPRPCDARGETHTGNEPIYFSAEADELARIVDALPPYRRDEVLAHARMVQIMEEQSKRDIEAALADFAAELKMAGLVLGNDAVPAMRDALLRYTATLLGTNALGAVGPVAPGNRPGNGSSKPRR